MNACFSSHEPLEFPAVESLITLKIATILPEILVGITYVYMYIWRLGLKSPLQKSIGGFKCGGSVRDHVNIYLCVCE